MSAVFADANRIFAEVLELPPPLREAHAVDLCAGDADLLALVRRLLAHAQRAGAGDTLHDEDVRRSGVWREAIVQLAHRQTLADGDRVGPYRLIRRIGHGGSAEVYLAERREDGVVQQVAIKLLLADSLDETSLARFRQEQQILARLNHPHIGKIFDVGRSSAGRPYYAMEYIDGEPVDQYCDRHGLDLRRRLQLLLRIADAVAHAHRELVVHRDIKPSNVLVDTLGEPRLLDFGIAKLIDGAPGDSEITVPGNSPGTVGYASPEQLAGRSAGVASDVYQLGMLAYVLLAGQRPYATRGLSGEEAAALARDPRRVPPSARLRQLIARGERDHVEAIAAQRRSKVDALLRGLHGDLDQVVLRAIAAEPEERYASVPQFADDIRNVLAHRPVSARAPSPWYVLSRAMRRHRLLSAAIAAALTGLVVFSIVVANLAWRLEQARLRTERQRTVAAQTLDFLIETFRSLEPEKSGGEGSLVKQALDKAAAAPPSRFGPDPAIRAELHGLLGRGYFKLQEFEQSYAQYQAMLRTSGQLQAPDRSIVEERALGGIGQAAEFLGRRDEARAVFERLARIERDDPHSRLGRAIALGNLAAMYSADGDIARARALMGSEVIPVLERELGPAHPTVFAARANDTRFLFSNERRSRPEDLELGVQLSERLMRDADASLGLDSEFAVRIRLDHYWAIAYSGDHRRAIALIREVLPHARRVLGDNHLHVLITRRALAMALAGSGDIDGALREMEANLAAMREHFPASHKNQPWTLFDYAVVLALAQRDEEAIAALQQSGIDPMQIRGEPHLARLRQDPRVQALIDKR